MDPLLPQNIISKLSPPILLPIHILHRHPPLGRYPGFNFLKCWHINMESCSTCRQTTAIVNRVRPSSHRRCSQLLKTECDRRNLLSTIIVACTCGMTPKSNNRQASFFRSGSDILEQASSNLFSLILIILKQNPPHSVIVSIWHLLCQIKCQLLHLLVYNCAIFLIQCMLTL